MIDLAPQDAPPRAGLGVQPIAIGAVALVLVLFGFGSIGLWRAFGNAPDQDHAAAAARQLQARTAQVSDALVEKTKGLEATQQESIDQLQVVQDQMQTLRQQLAAQQADTKKLSDQVVVLTEAVESLRQSFASSQSSEPAADQSPRKRSRTAHRRRGGSRS